MYRNTQPLSPSRHLNYSPLANYHFAARENFCPVFLQELPQVIREYFICFPNNQTDLPHAILGFEQGVNKYVTKEGTWQAEYVPAYIRRYPFILAKVQGSQQAGDEFTLAADVDAEHFQDPDGELLFDPQGGPTPLLQARIELLKGIEHQRMITQQAVRELDQAGLFKTERMTVKLKDKPVADITGLRMIDEDKLSSCGLRPGPALELGYAHLFSRAALQRGVLADKPTGNTGLENVRGIVLDDDMIRFQ